MSRSKTPKSALGYKIILLTFLASTLVMQLLAQDSTSTYRTMQNNRRHVNKKSMMTDDEGNIIFNKQNVFGIHLSSNGYGLSFEKGYFKTINKMLLYQFELNEVHSPKEHHITATTDGYNFSSVVPFKANNLYEVKAAIGQQRLIGGKGNKNGVAVSYLYSGGLTLGLLKPYLLDVSNPITGASTQMTYAQLEASQNNPQLFGYQPTGAAGFTAGWDKVAFKPALNARQAMRFDYGRENRTVAAIEVGVTEEYYASDINLMYGINGTHFFFNSYVAILFGGRK